MTAKPRYGILFVCLGNICRSPLAQGVLESVLAERGVAHRYAVDSAGIGAWHLGSAPDPRSIAVAARHGVDISMQKARRIAALDFERFDLILGMDRSNVQDLLEIALPGRAGHVDLFMRHATGAEVDVPDPYYGNPDGFAGVYRMVREASERLADRLERLSAPMSGHTSSTT